MSRLDDYRIGEVIGLGGSAIAVSAFVKSIQNNFGVKLKVVLKFLAGKDSGADEVNSLAQMSSASQYCNLYDAFVVSRQELYQFAGDKLEAVGELIGAPVIADDCDEITVIVLNLVSGEKLVERKPLIDDRPDGHGLIVETENGRFIDRLTVKSSLLTPKERIYILMEMAKALAKRHSLGVPHGDLNPGNVLWDPDLDEITLIDLGLNRNFGAPGWRSPEHQTLRGENRQKFTTAADVFVLGFWISLLMGTGSMTTLVKQCQNPEPKQRPSAMTVYNKLRKLYYATYYKHLFLTASVIVVMLGMLLWNHLSAPGLEDIFTENGRAYIQKIKSMDIANLASPKELRLEIQDYMRHPDMNSELRENLTRALAEYYRQARPMPKENMFSGNIEDIQGLWIGGGHLAAETWILYKGFDWWGPLGAELLPGHFFLKVQYRYPEIDLYFESFEGEQQIVTIPEFPYPWTESERQTLLLFDTTLEKVLENLCVVSDYHAAIPNESRTVLKGVYNFDNYDDLVDQFVYTTQGRLGKEDKKLSITKGEGDFLIWEISSSYMRQTSARKLLDLLLKYSNLRIGSGESLIRDELYLGVNASDIYWTDLLENYCLKEGATYVIKGDEIHFKNKEP